MAWLKRFSLCLTWTTAGPAQVLLVKPDWQATFRVLVVEEFEYRFGTNREEGR